MTNIFNIIMNLAKHLNQSTVDKLQKNVDAFLDKLGTNGKPLNHPEFFLPHSESPRYANGNYKQDYAEVELLSDEDLQTAKELFELHHTYTTESTKILKYFKATTMRAILVLAGATNQQATQILLDILPDFVKQDSNLLSKSGLNDDEIKQLQAGEFKYHNLFANKEDEEKLLNELKDPEVFELMEKYYALELLTNF
nr:MAG TPA: hypothetical protein [Caudoviricetes sp.]